MDKITLKHTDLNVSRICLGTMTFGSQTDEASATRMIDLCTESGINFLDTANVYNKGASEEMLGRVMGSRRRNFILASKVRNKMGDAPDLAGLSRPAILRAIDDSLRRLRTDYLDLYYLHLPDYSVPTEESLDAMNEVVKQGKVRYLASSNYSAWQMTEMCWIAERKGYQAPWVAQPMYNLIARGHRAGISADVQALRTLEHRLQSAGRRIADGQAQARRAYSGNAVRQEQNVYGSLLASRGF